jgi:hypothetical protein
MILLHLLSILMEAVVAALGVMLAISKKKMYGWCIALTFVLYVVYDLASLLALNISQDTLLLLFQTPFYKWHYLRSFLYLSI